jgi:hypothetical protein
VWDEQDEENAPKFCWENLGERNHLEQLGVGERIILKWIFKKYNGTVRS